MQGVTLDGSSLTLDDLIRVCRNLARVAPSDKALDRVVRGRKTLERIMHRDATIYGVNTGFGALSNQAISREELAELQLNLIRSHAASVGKPLSTDIVRAMMLLRANALLKGNSGVKPETIQLVLDLLNKHIHPVVPEQGSVGASGDLSPLSHIALVLIGEGKAELNGKTMTGDKALEISGLRPVELGAKEGLALNNGTQQMTAIGCLTIYDSYTLLKTSLAALAMSTEALTGWIDAYDERIHRLRPQKGQVLVAKAIRQLLVGSHLVRSYGTPAKGRPQDPYSFRCAPQVIGAAKDAFDFARGVLEVEMNSVTDNPLVFQDRIISGGNFHGQPVAMAMDVLGLGLSTLSNISERRTSALLDPSMNNGLPPFLVGQDTRPGLASGLMALQYSATALVAENKLLTHPASSDSIPTSANFEDFVSMGPGAAMKATRILENAQRVIAIELITAAQALDSRGTTKLSKKTREIYSTIRKQVPVLNRDRSPSEDVERVLTLIRQGQIAGYVTRLVDS